jgi:MFS family permease
LLDWAERAQPVLPLVGPLAPWQVLFIGLGVPGLLVALLVHFTLRDPPRRKSASEEVISTADAIAYFKANKTLFVLMFIGFAGFAINNYGFMVWGPSYFMRVHGLTIAEVGLLMGLGFAALGTSGVLLGGLWADAVQKKGHPEAPIAVAFQVAWVQVPFFLGAYLSPNEAVAIGLFCCGMFTASMVGGLQGAMVQALTPNRMRGVASAVYLTTVNILGLGLAPVLTAVLTDYVFGGPQGVGKSLAVTSVLSVGLAAAFLGMGMKRARARAAALLNDST